MSDSFNDSDFPKPSKISSGEFSYGSVFSLICEIRGSKYNIGDKFILVEQEDCTDPNILKLGGVGERYFIDFTGTGLIIHANDTTIDSIFCHIPETIIVEHKPDPIITESVLSEFKEDIEKSFLEIKNLIEIKGNTGDRGEQGLPGQNVYVEEGTGSIISKGERGERGEKGNDGARGVPGIQGKDGIKGDRGLKGDMGERGIFGPKGDMGQRGVAGPKGDKGIQGLRGETGVIGLKGIQGERGLQGSTGSSGVISAKFPLVYNEKEKSISIDETRLDAILKNILGGGRVSAQDMGWFASTGGGGKVAIKYNGEAITPDVRDIDFTGSGVASVTKIGGKVIVNITGGGAGSSIIDGGFPSDIYENISIIDGGVP